MKRIMLPLFVLLLIVGMREASAQAELSIQNMQLNGNELSFDVYLRSTTTATIYLTEASIYFSLDESKFTNLTATFASVTLPASYSFLVTLFDVTPKWVGIDVLFPQAASTTNTKVISTTGNGTQLGTVTLSGLTNFTDDINLEWGTTFPFETVAYRWDPNSNLEYPLLPSVDIPPVISLSDPVAVNLKVLLQGAYSSSGTMTTDLYTSALIPTTDPYSQGVTVASIPANVTDWVALEFRAATDNTVSIADTVGFVLNNGSVVALDGSSQIPMSPSTVPPGSYYVVIRHRNHMAIMSSTSVTLTQNSSTLYDFTTNQGQAFTQWQSAMIQVGSSPDVFAMAAGDADQDGIINAVDRVNIRNDSGSGGYLSTDITLDGTVDTSDENMVNSNNFVTTQIP